jgi:hypothetical protein
LSAANAVIALAKERFTKNLWSDRSSAEKPALVSVQDDAAQARFVAERVLANREVVEKLLQTFQAELDGPNARERALVLIALCVGGMVLARGVDGPVLADDIRAAAYRQALSVAGWCVPEVG